MKKSGILILMMGFCLFARAENREETIVGSKTVHFFKSPGNFTDALKNSDLYNKMNFVFDEHSGNRFIKNTVKNAFRKSSAANHKFLLQQKVTVNKYPVSDSGLIPSSDERKALKFSTSESLSQTQILSSQQPAIQKDLLQDSPTGETIRDGSGPGSVHSTGLHSKDLVKSF